MERKIKQSLRNLDWTAFRPLLPPSPPLGSNIDLEQIVIEVMQSSALCVYHDDHALLSRRDAFAASFEAELVRRGLTELAARFTEAVARDRQIELGYHAILRTVETKLRPRLSPVRHAWASLCNLEREAYALRLAIKNKFETSSGSTVNLGAAWVTAQSGNQIDVDEQMERAASLSANTLLMLGQQNHWFSGRDQQLVVPHYETVDSNDIGPAVADVHLANSYSLLRQSADKIRHFGGSVTRERRTIPFQDGEREVDTLSLVWPVEFDISLSVAHQRLRQMLAQWYVDAMLKISPAVRAAFKSLQATKLPPVEFVSEDELCACIALSQLLRTPVAEHNKKYGGLTICEWLRGYSVLKEYANSKINADLVVNESDPSAVATFIAGCLVAITPADLLAALQRRGLSGLAAANFLQAVVFSRSHPDVIDAPLIRCADGRLFLLPRVARTLEPAMVVLSQLSRIGADLAWKGTAFERDLVDVFADAKLNAKPFHWKRKGEEVQIDCILAWDGHIFVIECKNAALPNSGEGSKYHFIEEQIRAVGQAKSKLQWLQAHPEVLDRLFGTLPATTAWIPVVVNALPFAFAGQVSDVFVTDASTIGRFFEDPYVSQNVIGGFGQDRSLMVRQVLRQFYQGRPTPADFIKMLNDPPQLAITHQVTNVSLYPSPLTDDFVLLVPVVTRDEVDLATVAEALGVDPNDAASHQGRIDDFLANVTSHGQLETNSHPVEGEGGAEKGL